MGEAVLMFLGGLSLMHFSETLIQYQEVWILGVESLLRTNVNHQHCPWKEYCCFCCGVAVRPPRRVLTVLYTFPPAPLTINI